jgi:phytoene dehydrogenase-like protein
MESAATIQANQSTSLGLALGKRRHGPYQKSLDLLSPSVALLINHRIIAAPVNPTDTHQPTPHRSHPVVIIGAGVAGLACAVTLRQAGINALILEASNEVGGRIKTEELDGYLLDHGFQVLLMNYPTARKLLDYEALDLKLFYPGAMIRREKKWHMLADPQRHPLDATRALFAPIGSITDKLRVAFKGRGGYDLAKHGADASTDQALRAEGFSERMIESFFRPFLGGVFQEKDLATSVQKLDFVMNHFSNGDTAVPAKGMAEIPRQLAAQLAAYQFRFASRVVAIKGHTIELADGEMIDAESIVIATDAQNAARLLALPDPAPAFHSSTCLYFRAPKTPSTRAILWLNGETSGPINHLAVMSAVSPAYAPPGEHLVAVNVIDPMLAQAENLEELVRAQLRDWFGAMTDEWSLLRKFFIKNAIPAQGQIAAPQPEPRHGVYQCGDHQGVASIETALVTGVNVAQRIINSTQP